MEIRRRRLAAGVSASGACRQRSVTLAVNSLEQQIADLNKCGIEAGQPMRNPKVYIVMIKDPDGNSIAFAEALDASMAQ
jgi:hypothetical protein